METHQEELNRAVAAFVAQVTALAHGAAMAALEDGFAQHAAAGARGAANSPTMRSGSPGRPKGGRGNKRTAVELEQLSINLLKYIGANPGQRVEQIGKGIGIATKELALPIRKLIGEGILLAKGQRRATTYTLSKKAK
jgi:hypothetical protein